MILVLCIGAGGELSFCKRRVSRDAIQRQHLLKQLDNHQIYMNQSAATMYGLPYRELPEYFEENDYFLLEYEDVDLYLKDAQIIYLYRWNKNYLADNVLDLTLLRNHVMIHNETFRGKTHDNITFEVYYAKEQA